MTPADSVAPPEATAQAWSQLWADSARGSIDLSSSDPLATALRDHWQRQLPWLRGCAQVLDVGSGPAVLAQHLIASDPAGLSEVRWCCIDRARFPDGLVGALLPRVRLHGGVDFATSVPIDGCVQGLLSNFGLEYVDRDGLAAACARWLAGGGHLSAVLHARDSVIDRASALSASDIGFALDEVRLYACAHELYDALSSVPPDPALRATHAKSVRAAYNAAVDAIKRRIDERGSHSAVLLDMLVGIRDRMSWVPQGRLVEAQSELSRLRSAYAAELARLRDMQAHALDAPGIEALLSRLHAAGFEHASCVRLDCAAGVVGWTLSARRG